MNIKNLMVVEISSGLPGNLVFIPAFSATLLTLVSPSGQPRLREDDGTSVWSK